MTSEPVKQLQSEIEQAILKSLNNSDLVKVLESYGLSGQNILQLEIKLDPTQLEVCDTADIQKTKDLLQAIKARGPIVVFAKGFCKPCPIRGFPFGCWVG